MVGWPTTRTEDERCSVRGRGDPTRRQTWSGGGVRSTPFLHMPLPYDVTIISIISSVHWPVRVDFHASGQALLEENDVAL